MGFKEAMNRLEFDEVKRTVSLQEFAERYLRRSPRDSRKFVCPCCKSGDSGKPDSDSAFNIKDDKWHCFSCQKSGDVFDLAGLISGTDDKREQLKIVAEFSGVSGNDYSPCQNKPVESPQKPDYAAGRAGEAEYIKKAQTAIWQRSEAISYLQERGFNEDDIRRYGLGYDPDAKGAKDDGGKWLNPGRVVIPLRGCDYYHTDRIMTNSHIDNGKYSKPASEKVGYQPIDNADAASKADVLFMVEGMFDALAVDALGYDSLGLCGTAYRNAVDMLAERGFDGLLIVMLDGDDAGRKEQPNAVEYAREKGLKHVTGADDFSALTGCKDACEALALDVKKARAALDDIASHAMEKADDEAETAREKALEALNVQDAGEIAAAVLAGDGYEVAVPTGFKGLDDALNGGMRSGLYVMGATSSAGKTTLMVQVADWMARNGRPVLFVTIEQSGREIVCKSLSRLMDDRGLHSIAIWDMNDKLKRMSWDDRMAAALSDAVQEYRDAIAPNMHIMAADEQPTVKTIRAAADAVRSITGIAPIVIIDYLQLIKPSDDRATEKQAADYNVSELRRMARDMRTPVVVISSLNRKSYSGVIEMDAFKESGGIEYGADVLMGLQPYKFVTNITGKNAETKANEVMKSFRASSTRQCEIVILKNRNGRIPSEPIPMTFYASASKFEDGV